MTYTRKIESFYANFYMKCAFIHLKERCHFHYIKNNINMLKNTLKYFRPQIIKYRNFFILFFFLFFCVSVYMNHESYMHHLQYETYAIADLNYAEEFHCIQMIFEKTRSRTNRQTGFINAFQLCKQILRSNYFLNIQNRFPFLNQFSLLCAL